MPDGTDVPSDVKGKATTYERLQFKALTSADADTTSKFYVSGTAGLTISNWTGTATYINKVANPVWELTNGAQTLSGTFTGPPTALTASRRSRLGLPQL